MRSPLILLVVVLALCAAVVAQTEGATLSGFVTDGTGAALVGAEVRATNVETNIVQTTKTNQVGLYVFSNLLPGRYRISVANQGFKEYVRQGLVLHVQDTVSQNVRMEIGAASESITVSGDTPSINTESAAVGTVVERRFVANMPLNGRSFQTLIALAPGVTITQATFGEQGQFSVNGQRADANYYTVDGVTANFGISAGGTLGQSGGGALPALGAGGVTSGLVSVDAMQEFRIQTSTFAAEYGRSPGGQISIATRSGTNQFHGSAFEYLRNDVLDANNWFANHNGLPKPKERQNDFGGVLGGPLVKDRTFFFFSYEGLRLRQPVIGNVLVPSQAARAQAPSSLKPIFNAFPLPTGVDQGNGYAAFVAGYSDPTSLDAVSTRLDHRLNDQMTLFGRVNYSPSIVRQRTGGLSEQTTSPFDILTVTGGVGYAISPTLFNDFRLNFSRQKSGLSLSLDNFGGATPPPTSALFPSFADASKSFYQLSILDGNATTVRTGAQNQNANRQWNVVDSLSARAGAHQLKFGVDYRHLYSLLNAVPYGLFYFFNTLQGALAGIANTGRVRGGMPTETALMNWSSYAQDTWKMKSALTLTYGVRWDINPPLHGVNDTAIYTVLGLESPATATLAPKNTPLYKTRFGSVAPRIGVAYQISTDTVVRGGFGIFYDSSSGPSSLAASGTPSFSTVTYSNVSLPLTDAQLTPLPVPNLAPPWFFTSNPVQDLRTPYTFQWNVAVERNLGSIHTLGASYVGAAGRDLYRLSRFSNLTANPKLGQLFTLDNSSYSNYDSLQLQFRRQMSHGLQAIVGYTWSHSLDNASEDSSAGVPGGVLDPRADYGSSSFDIRHTVTAATSYDLPHLSSNSTIAAITRGFGIDVHFIARSALPTTPLSTTTVGIYRYSLRPDLVSGQPLYLDDPTAPGGRRFNRSAFQIVTGRQGNMARNALRGFPMSSLSAAIRREFRLTEALRLQARLEAFNVLNHPNFATPSGSLTSSAFGISTSTLSFGEGGANGGLSPLYQVSGARSAQVALKLTF